MVCSRSFPPGNNRTISWSRHFWCGPRNNRELLNRKGREETTGVSSGIGAAALLVLLAGAAGAGIVAADLGPAANHLLDGLAVSRPGHAGLLEFAALLALEGFLEDVYGSGDLAGRAAAIAVVSVSNRSSCRAKLRIGWSGRSGWGFAAADDLHQVQIADGVFPKALHHLFEHVEGLALI